MVVLTVPCPHGALEMKERGQPRSSGSAGSGGSELELKGSLFAIVLGVCVPAYLDAPCTVRAADVRVGGGPLACCIALAVDESLPPVPWTAKWGKKNTSLVPL